MDVEEHGDIVTVTLTLPFLPPSKNVYDGWPPAWKAGAKKKWIRVIGEMCAEQQVPTGLWSVGLAATLVFARNARRDPQNYAQALWNWVPDALVRCGVLRDDRAGAIEIGPNWGLQMTIDDRRSIPEKKRQRTILTLAYRPRLEN